MDECKSVKERYIGTKIIMAEPGVNNIQMGIHPPGTDGMIVEYPDGYKSWSPLGAFNDTYRLCRNMNFGLAIEAMKKGCKVARKGWNGKGIFIKIQMPDADSKMTHPYIYINTTGLKTDNPDAPKNCVPWLASQTDMLSDDWLILE